MSPASAAATAELPRAPAGREVRLLQGAVVLFCLIRLWMHLAAEPFGDETYYWLWGQHPGWSYFDHPPLHAWLLRGVEMLLGWHPINTRILTWVTLAATLLLFRLWAAWLAPADPAPLFWHIAAVYLASPLFFAFTLVSYNDHLLIVLCLASATAFLAFVTRWEERGAGFRWLYAGAALLGLAVLTKYNGVFLGLGFGLLVLLRPTLRPLLRSPHLWLAAALAIAMQAPVFWWNATEGFASYRFHISDRWGGIGDPDWLAPLSFLVYSALSLGPLLLWPLARFLFRRPKPGFEARARGLALAVLGVSTLLLCLAAIWMGAFFYWNIVAFIGLVPLLAYRMRSAWLIGGHVVLGLVFAVLVVVNFAVVPFLGGGGVAVNYGWAAIAERVGAQAAAQHVDFVAGTRYANAAQLGFATGNRDVTALSAEHDQFDHWFDPSMHAGEDALILSDDNDGPAAIAYLEARFESLEKLEDVPVERFGRRIFNHAVWLGRGFRP